MMNFISFSIVKETNVRRRKKFLSKFDFEKELTQLSEIEKIKLINWTQQIFGRFKVLAPFWGVQWNWGQANQLQTNNPAP